MTGHLPSGVCGNADLTRLWNAHCVRSWPKARVLRGSWDGSAKAHMPINQMPTEDKLVQETGDQALLFVNT